MKEQARLSPQAKLAKEVTYEAPITLYGTARVKKDCTIGAYTFINSNTTVYPGTNIGRYCSIGKNCEVAAFDHPIDWLSTSPFQYNMKLHFPQHEGECHQTKPERPEQTTIGNDVWIGANCIIKRGISIADGAIVAGGAVVIKDVPPYAIVGGVPAKILKYRFNKKRIEKLISLRWWELTPIDLDGVQFNDIKEAIKQIANIKNIEIPSPENTTKNLQKLIDKRMEISKNKEPKMTFEEIKSILNLQLLEAEIEEDVVNEIMQKNQKMHTDYDMDEHEDQIILNHKIEAITEIILLDTQYKSKQKLSFAGYKKIKNVLQTKH